MSAALGPFCYALYISDSRETAQLPMLQQPSQRTTGRTKVGCLRASGLHWFSVFNGGQQCRDPQRLRRIITSLCSHGMSLCATWCGAWYCSARGYTESLCSASTRSLPLTVTREALSNQLQQQAR